MSDGNCLSSTLTLAGGVFIAGKSKAWRRNGSAAWSRGRKDGDAVVGDLGGEGAERFSLVWWDGEGGRGRGGVVCEMSVWCGRY